MNNTLALMLVGVGFFVVVIFVIWYILQIVAYWKIFTKAGEPGWKSLIPIYNTYVQYKLTWNTRPFWGWFICLIGVAVCTQLGESMSALDALGGAFSLGCSVFSIVGSYKLSKAFGHGIGFTIGLILLTPVFMLILGFGESRYIGPQV